MDPSLYAEPCASQCDSLGMVASTGGDHARRTLLLIELADQIERTPDLVGAHWLQIITLEQHLGAGRGGQPGTWSQRGVGDAASDPLRGGLHIGQVKGHNTQGYLQSIEDTPRGIQSRNQKADHE